MVVLFLAQNIEIKKFFFIKTALLKNKIIISFVKLVHKSFVSWNKKSSLEYTFKHRWLLYTSARFGELWPTNPWHRRVILQNLSKFADLSLYLWNGWTQVPETFTCDRRWVFNAAGDVISGCGMTSSFWVRNDVTSCLHHMAAASVGWLVRGVGVDW